MGLTVKQRREVMERTIAWLGSQMDKIKEPQTSLGLDLSYTSTGYVVLEDGEVIRHGTFGTKADCGMTIIERNRYMYSRFFDILHTYQPDVIGMESINVYKNPQASQRLIYTEAEFYHALQDYTENFYNKGSKPPLIRIGNSQIKKVASNEGGGDKAVILKDVLLHHGVNLDSDDEADAFCAGLVASTIQVFVRHYYDMYQANVTDGDMSHDKFLQQFHLEKFHDQTELPPGLYAVCISMASAESCDTLKTNSREEYDLAREAIRFQDSDD